MPRVARFKIAAIQDLYQQCRYVPAETQRRLMDAAEQLARDIDPARNYPSDFVIYRVTGYRLESEDEPLMLVGAALLPDVVNLVQRMSRPLDLPWNYNGRRALPLKEVAHRLGVTLQTVQRYRRRGLVCHYVRFADGGPRLACFEDALEFFAAAHRAGVDRAASFSRTSGRTKRAILEEARALRDREKLSLNAAAKQLAAAHGRAHETVRGILQRHDRRSAQPIFAAHGPLTERDVRLIERAWRMGVSASALARRFTRTPASIHRVLHRARAQRWLALDLTWVELPTFALPDAEEVILAAPAVTSGLEGRPTDEDAAALIEAARAATGASAADVDALVAGYNALKRRARTALEAGGAWPGAHVLDGAETDLRWAALLKARLLWLALPAAILSIERTLHRPLEQEAAEEIVGLLTLAFTTLSRMVETLDPSRDHRLTRRASYEMERALARRASGRSGHRAAARHASGSVPLSGHWSRLCPWQPWLDLRRDWRPLVARLQAADRDLIARRYGLDGRPPGRCLDLARSMNLTEPGLARRLRRAEQTLRAWGRDP